MEPGMNPNNNMNNNGSHHGGSGDNSPIPGRAGMNFNDPSASGGFPGGGGGGGNDQMNQMMMMSQFPGMMGNMGNMPNQQEMMNMMGGYCGPAGGNPAAGGMGGMGMGGPGFANFPTSDGGMGGGPQGGMNPQQAMAQMMRNKRPMDGGFDDSEQSPVAKRPNFGQDMPNINGSDGSGPASVTGGDNNAPQDNNEKPSADANSNNSPGTGPKQHVTIMASKEGIKFYSRNDVLCGRGGGTNVHPGNRRFRDLINANRRAYLKARKNDKPAISRSIVRTIREMNGRFLKKDEKQGLWFEIGDDGAREKTSQALRQRAPEMRKILFEDEQRVQQQQQQELMMQRQQMMAGGMGGMGMGGMGMGMNPGMAMGMGQGPGSMGGGNQQGGGGQGGPNGGGGDMSNSLLAKYNMLHQKNWLAQEKNLILQRLAMSGLNPQNLNNTQNNIDSMTTQTLMSQGMKPVTPRGA